MRRRVRTDSSAAPSLVPLADMLTNTVGIVVFILVFTVLTAGGAVITRPPIEQETTKKEIFVVCAHDRVLPLDLNRINDAVYRQIGEPSPDNLDAWARRLANARMASGGYAVRGRVEFSWGDIPVRGVVHLRALPDWGEDVPQASAVGSAFLSALHGASPRDRFVYFLVYPDSIDAFGRARELAKQAGFETGWYPKGSEEAVTSVIWSVDPDEKGLRLVPQSTRGRRGPSSAG